VTRWGALLLVIGASLGFAAPAKAGPPATPNDQLFALQWNLQAIGAPVAWQVATGAGITIAVVDSGVDLTHEDLKGKVIADVTCIGAAGDFTKCKPGGQDDNGHGTHVAGIAAANTNNATTDFGGGVAGVAPDASILDVKVLRQSCDTINGCDASGTADDVIAGINYAVEHGAKVINLSLGNTSQSVLGHSFAAAVNAAFSRGVISVIAAGNDFLLPSGGSDVNAIIVGALNRNDTKASYGNPIGDAKWGLMAPGGEPDTPDGCATKPVAVLSTYFNNKYACLAGTSMAAPHVSGAVAVLLSMGLSPQKTIDQLRSTARNVGPAAVYGSGALDLAAAVGKPATPSPNPPPAEQTPPPAASEGTVVTADTVTNSTDSASSSTVSTPSGDLGSPTSTSPPVINLPSQRAAAPAPARVTARPKSNEDLSPGLVIVAVLMAGAVGCAVGWFALRGSSLARRTPPL
jgi:serine protease